MTKEEVEKLFKEKSWIKVLVDYSKDLPPTQLRCPLCNGIAVSEGGLAGSCDCKFIGFDYCSDNPAHHRYMCDRHRLGKNEEK